MARNIYVPQAGRHIAFKDGAADADIMRFIEQRYPSAPTQPVAAVPPQDEGGVFSLKDTIKGVDKYLTDSFVTGISDIPGGLSSLFTDKKTALTDWSDDMREAGAEKLGIDRNKELTTIEKGASVIGSAASFFVPALGQAKAVGSLVANAPKIAKLLTKTGGGLNAAGKVSAYSAPFIQGGAVTANQRRLTIEEQRKSGMQISPEQQLWAQRFDFAVGTLEGIPMGRFLKPLENILSKVPAAKKAAVEKVLQNRLSRVAGGVGAEAAQEAVSGVLSDLVEMGVYNPDVAVGDDVISDLAAGGFAGGFMEGLVQILAGKRSAGARQLANDSATEADEVATGVRRAQVVDAVNALKSAGVYGPLDVKPVTTTDPQSGFELTEFQVTDRGGNRLFNVEDPEIAAEAVDLYRNETQAAVMLRRDVADAFDKPGPTAVSEELGGTIKTKHDKESKHFPKNARETGSPDLSTSFPFGGSTKQTISMPATSLGGTTQPGTPVNTQQLERDVQAPAVRPTETVTEAPLPSEAAPETVTENPADAVVDYTPPAFQTSFAPSTQPGVMSATAQSVEAVEDAPSLAIRYPSLPNAPESPINEATGPLEGEGATGIPETDYAPPMASPVTMQIEGVGKPVLNPKVEAETAKRRNAIATAVNDRLRAIGLADVGVKFSALIRDDFGNAVPALGSAEVVQEDGKPKSVIELAIDIYDPSLTTDQLVEKVLDTLNHEAVHAMVDAGVLRPAEYNILKRAAQDTRVPGKKYTYVEKAAHVYEGQYENPELIYEEAIADMFKDWKRNPKDTPRQTWGLFNRILQVLRRVFQGFKASRSDALFKRMDEGEIGSRPRDFKTTEKKYDIARSTVDADDADWVTTGTPEPGKSSVNGTGASPYRISQRRPTAKNFKTLSVEQNLMADIATMRLDPEAFAHNMNILRSYVNMPVVAGETPEETLQRFVDHGVENLLWLHDKVPEKIRLQSKRWYDGARKITDDLAVKYNIPDTSAAAVLAALSPQKDWFQNVSLGKRLIEIVATKGGHKFDEQMLEKARETGSFNQYSRLLTVIDGLTLDEIGRVATGEIIARKHNYWNAMGVTPDDFAGVAKVGEAMFVRLYDETYNPRSYPIISPEGEEMGTAMTKSGEPQKVAWGSLSMITKGIDAYRDGSKETVDELLGNKHKIRSFYNNIISPNATDGSVTADTHAVAAALFRPLSGNDLEVHHNFGTSPKGVKGPSKSAIHGLMGLYPIYAEIYRKAARERRILPREMQSITWEAIRGLFVPTFKSDKRNIAVVDAVWREYKDGKITAEEARNTVHDLAGQINNPFWYTEGGAAQEPGGVVYEDSGDTADEGELRSDELAGDRPRKSGRGKPVGDTKRTGVKKYSLAANPEFKRWFGGSVMTNPDGSPKRFFHGTPKSFSQFGKARSGNIRNSINEGPDGPFFFTDNPKFASSFAESAFHAGGKGKAITSGGRVIPVYLSVKKPFDFENEEHRLAIGRSMAADRYLEDVEGFAQLMSNSILDGSWSTLERPDVQKAMRDSGFDAFWMKEGAFRNIAVFNAEQIKSTFNEFEPGAATSKKFSLTRSASEAPIDPLLERENDTLFAKVQPKTIRDTVFDYFLGNDPGKGRLTLAMRVNIVDRDAALLDKEKTRNKRINKTEERERADFSAYTAMQMARRSSHVAAAVLRMGAPVIVKTNGDIQSAYVKVNSDPDNMVNVIKKLMSGPPDADGQPTSLLDAFRTYAVAKRGRRLDASGKEVPMTQAYMRAAMAIPRQYPQVLEAYDMYQRYNKKLIMAARDAGVIEASAADEFTRMMDHYSFYREIGEDMDAQTSGTKIAGQIRIVPYKGSKLGALAGDPMMVMIHNSNFWVNAILKNIAAQKSFNLLHSMNEARQLGWHEKPDISAGEVPEVMHMRVNGVSSRFAVKDYLLAKSIGSDDRMNLGGFMKLVGLPTKILRESVTRNPTFVVTNMLRDTFSTWVTRGEDFKPIVDTLTGYKKAFMGHSSYEALMGFGVVGSYDESMKTPEQMGKALRHQALPKNVLSIHSVGEGLNAAWHFLGRLSDASDAASRIPVYESVLRETGSEAEAAFRALDMMNFSRSGSSTAMQILIKMIPFLNARIQGLDVVYQGGRSAYQVATGDARGDRDRQVGKAFLVRGAMLAALSVALEAMLSDDEDYEQLDDYIKTGNLLIPIGESQFLAIPKPFETGLLFSTIPQRLYRLATGKDNGRQAAGFFFDQMITTFGVNLIPQAGIPWVENSLNIDLHTGLPLVSPGKAALAPEMRYNASTSTLARVIGDHTVMYNFVSGRWESTAPIMVDNIVNGYGGPLATYLTGAVSWMINQTEAGPAKLPVGVTNMPGVRSFFVEARDKNPKAVSEAYEVFKMVDEVGRTFNRLKKMGDVEAATAYLHDNRDIIGTKKYMMKVVDTLNNIRAMERMLERDTTLSDDDKLEKMRYLRQLEIEATRGVDQVNKIIGR